MTDSPPPAEQRYIVAEGDAPKVERTRQYFWALRAGLKTSEETSYFLQRDIERLLAKNAELEAELAKLRKAAERVANCNSETASPALQSALSNLDLVLGP